MPTRRRQIWSWAFYDFANSAYTTLIVTFVYAVFFTQQIAADPIIGTTQWAHAVALSAIVVALVSPFVGTAADNLSGPARHTTFVLLTALTVALTSLLYLPLPGQVLFALTVFVLSDIFFEVSGVIYNSYLPRIAPQAIIGRISGYGWALGYVGGLLAMALALFAFVQPEQPWFGLSRESGQNYRATALLVAIWYAVFSVPMFLWLRGNGSAAPSFPLVEALRRTPGQLAATFRQLRGFRDVFQLLVARLIYNDGVVTIFAFGPIYASETFDFTFTELMLWGVALNVTAGLGAYLMGILDDKIGGKKTIAITLAGLTLGTLMAVSASNKTWLWIAGIIVGIFIGPNQAASRSLLGRFVPPGKESEFYGFFAFSGKAMAFLGPLLLGIATAHFESQRAGIATILGFFLLGGLLLAGVNERRGIETAARPAEPPPSSA
ncbi:MAG TPA: MFS transporter [Verrucomicrobiales bacterium]|nr:MFS transporter [Verrucomicrobiales bacterium]